MEGGAPQESFLTDAFQVIESKKLDLLDHECDLPFHPEADLRT